MDVLPSLLSRAKENSESQRDQIVRMALLASQFRSFPFLGSWEVHLPTSLFLLHIKGSYMSRASHPLNHSVGTALRALGGRRPSEEATPPQSSSPRMILEGRSLS